MENQQTPRSPEIVKPNYLIVAGAFLALFLIVGFLAQSIFSSSEETLLPGPWPHKPSLYPAVSQQMLTFADIEALSANELRMLRNEVFARRGWVFDDPGLRAHFESQPWYQPRHNNEAVAQSLSPVEQANTQFLRAVENGFAGFTIQEMFDALASRGGDLSLLHHSTARVNTPGDGFLALRDAPTVKSEMLIQIPHGAPVLVLDFSGEWDQIYGKQGQWYLVEYQEFVGWAWGWLLIKM